MLKAQEATLLQQWLAKLNSGESRVAQLLGTGEQEKYSARILTPLMAIVAAGDFQSVDAREYQSLLSILTELSTEFAERSLTPSETATYVFSLKEVLFEHYKQQYSGEELTERLWQIGLFIDKLGLFTFEAFTSARERVIISQAQSLSELSSPVIKVWDGIIALPLVGSVDSMRAKDIMEKLLDAVIANDADIVIIDITGVPVVDTQVANRLMRTVESVRLLGTKSIITGINPIIAQTLVQLGVDLSQLTTKASLQAGLQQAFRELRFKVVAPESRR